MHGIWNVCVGAATILPVWAAPLTTGPAMADETRESAPIVRWAEHRTAEAAEEPALVRDDSRCSDGDCR